MQHATFVKKRVKKFGGISFLSYLCQTPANARKQQEEEPQ